MWNIGERQHLTPADRMWMGISLFWSFGCANALLAVMTHGGTIVLARRRSTPRRRAGPDRARALHRLLRHPQHRARPRRASRPGAARSLLAAHRRRDRPAAGDADGDGSRRARDLQRLRPHRDLRQLQRHRRARPGRHPADDRRAPAAGHGDPHRRPRDAKPAADGRGRRDSRPRLSDARLLQGSGEERRGVRRRRLSDHR